MTVHDPQWELQLAAAKRELDEALKLVRLAGYRVSKPKPKKQSRVGPTCVVTFADGVTTRMTTACSDERLNFELGTRLCIAAWQSRVLGTCVDQSPEAHPPVRSVHFERDGERLLTEAA